MRTERTNTKPIQRVNQSSSFGPSTRAPKQCMEVTSRRAQRGTCTMIEGRPLEWDLPIPFDFPRCPGRDLRRLIQESDQVPTFSSPHPSPAVRGCRSYLPEIRTMCLHQESRISPPAGLRRVSMHSPTAAAGMLHVGVRDIVVTKTGTSLIGRQRGPLRYATLCKATTRKGTKNGIDVVLSRNMQDCTFTVSSCQRVAPPVFFVCKFCFI